MVDLAAAYASCARDARAHYENFPVASLLLPRRMRPHVAAVYAFARAADDFADEGERSVEERHALLDLWQCRLREAASSPLEETRPATTGEPANAREIFIAIGATMRACRLEPTLFEDLLSAFRQDVTVARYPTWNDLFDYCRRSANPIGRLVLRIGGGSSETFDRWSDAICTALQLTNFWQDVVRDYGRRRIILEPSQRFGEPFDRAFSGLALNAQGSDYRTFRVMDVLEESPATDAGIEIGDVIESIDDVPAARLTMPIINVTANPLIGPVPNW